MAKRKNAGPKRPAGKTAEGYRHPDQTVAMRPEVGTQAQFRKKKPPQTYRYDSSLSPALDWDGQNGARELGEWLLALIDEASALPSTHAFDTPREFRSADGHIVVTVRSLREAVDQLNVSGAHSSTGPARPSASRSTSPRFRSLSTSASPPRPSSRRLSGIGPTSRWTCSSCSAIRGTR